MWQAGDTLAKQGLPKELRKCENKSTGCSVCACKIFATLSYLLQKGRVFPDASRAAGLTSQTLVACGLTIVQSLPM